MPVLFSCSAGIYQDRTSNQAMTTSFHVFSGSLFFFTYSPAIAVPNYPLPQFRQLDFDSVVIYM